MSKTAIIAIFALIAIALIVVFIYTLSGIYKYSTQSQRQDKNQTGILLPQLSTTVQDVESWYSSMSKSSQQGFKPITNELYIHFDLIDASEVRKKKFFKLSISKNDSYSLFCIKQTVLKMNLKYFFVNTRKNANIIIDTDDVSTLHHLVDSLKNYNINSSFEEIWI